MGYYIRNFILFIAFLIRNGQGDEEWEIKIPQTQIRVNSQQWNPKNSNGRKECRFHGEVGGFRRQAQKIRPMPANGK